MASTNSMKEQSRTQIVPETRCYRTDCIFSCMGVCTNISALMLSLEIGGLPEPDGCCSDYVLSSESKAA